MKNTLLFIIFNREVSKRKVADVIFWKSGKNELPNLYLTNSVTHLKIVHAHDCVVIVDLIYF